VGAFTVLVAILLAWLLVRGSKAAWIIAIASGAADLVFSIAGEKTSWGMVIDGVVLVGLVVPPSIRFFWGVRTKDSPAEPAPAGALDRIRSIAYGLLARAAGWEEGGSQAPRFRLLTWRLAVASLLLLGPVGLTYGWAQGGGHDRALAVVANLVWMCWALVTVACLVAGALALWERLTGRLPSSPSS
jgi:hypothetical protein